MRYYVKLFPWYQTATNMSCTAHAASLPRPADQEEASLFFFFFPEEECVCETRSEQCFRMEGFQGKTMADKCGQLAVWLHLFSSVFHSLSSSADITWPTHRHMEKGLQGVCVCVWEDIYCWICIDKITIFIFLTTTAATDFRLLSRTRAHCGCSAHARQSARSARCGRQHAAEKWRRVVGEENTTETELFGPTVGQLIKTEHGVTDATRESRTETAMFYIDIWFYTYLFFIFISLKLVIFWF